jgi:hypothetical protein
MRKFRISCDSFVSDMDSGAGPRLDSSPNCQVVASFNAWSRFSGFFFFPSMLIFIFDTYIDNIGNSDLHNYTN